MRLEEWYKHVESFEQTSQRHGEQQNGPPADASPQPPASMPSPEDSARSNLRRFSDGAGVGATFRSIPAPPAATVVSGQSRPVPTRQSRLASVLPVQKESREQLLARLLDPVLTLEETAQVLNVCPTTVRRYTNKGLLQHYRTSGNQRRFRLSHVLNFLGEVGGSLETGTLMESLEMSGSKQIERRARTTNAVISGF